ncbi:MAG: sulfatase [Clostridia bacterium]|nr:sulfatase [Clostridia bacterium]
MERKRPNIVLMNCDDLGYGDLGCYGSGVNNTPEIDRLAAEGLRLTDFYMASPVCSPSRGAMLTGCYPPRIGFGDFDGQWVLFPGQGLGLSGDETTIADALRAAGYRTGIVGKWHCGDQPAFLPTRHGFDTWFGLPYSNDMGRQKGLTEPYCPLPLMRGEEVVQQQPDLRALTERYADEAVRFMRDAGGRPFFLYFAHMHVHLPLYAAERFCRDSENGDYGACVAAVDWTVAVIRQELRRLGADRDTLFIFTSDNGSRGDHGASNAPLRGTKGTTWEGGMRVPCILHWPGVIEPGRVSSRLVASIDLFPTLAALAGATLPAGRALDGCDQSGLLSAETGTPAREVFYYYMRNTLEAVRWRTWKLHLRKEDGTPVPMLFDLADDPGETRNRALDRPELVARLTGLADAMRRDLGDDANGIPGPGRRPPGRVDDPVYLTEYDPGHPYICAMYDKEDRG